MAAAAHSYVAVERDAQGLQVALRELFEEAYLREAIGDMMDEVDEEARARVTDDLPARSLSPGYYDQAGYILDLASTIECGVGFAADKMSRSDVLGLQALKRARNEYEYDHPPCGRCGTRQDNRWATQCRGCAAKLNGKGD